MAQCECLAKCLFFNDKMEKVPALAGMMKKKYCLNEFQACARYQVFKVLGREGVPDDLFPNQHERVKECLQKV